MKPFLKWAGNKTPIAQRVAELLPKTATRLIEPFVGSGALFAATDYPTYFLADDNLDLIRLYEVIAHSSDELIGELSDLWKQGTEAEYYSLRGEYNLSRRLTHGTADVRSAALFIYLNRHGYRGLYRVNRKQGFNVPYGRYSKPYFPELEIQQYSKKLRQTMTDVRCLDFRSTMSMAQFGDVVYCDPPYVPVSATADFASYTASGFTKQGHIDLADCATRLAQRGVPVVVSNSDTPFTRWLYERRGARIVSLSVRRSISCKERGNAGEILAVFGGQEE